VHRYCTHKHTFSAHALNLLSTKCTPYHNIAVYWFISLLHMQSAIKPILWLLHPILVHCYMHFQVSGQYCGYCNQYWFTSLLHALSAIEPMLRVLQLILVHIIVTCIVSYRANIIATTANIDSHHSYMHSQLPSQYRGYYSQYWFTSLLHALSAIEPISLLLQPILVHIIVTCIVSYQANIAATIANIGFTSL